MPKHYGWGCRHSKAKFFRSNCSTLLRSLRAALINRYCWFLCCSPHVVMNCGYSTFHCHALRVPLVICPTQLQLSIWDLNTYLLSWVPTSSLIWGWLSSNSILFKYSSIAWRARLLSAGNIIDMGPNALVLQYSMRGGYRPTSGRISRRYSK